MELIAACVIAVLVNIIDKLFLLDVDLTEMAQTLAMFAIYFKLERFFDEMREKGD